MVLYYQSYITVILKPYYTINILRIKPKSALLYILKDWFFFPSQKAKFWWGKISLFERELELARTLAVWSVLGCVIGQRRTNGIRYFR